MLKPSLSIITGLEGCNFCQLRVVVFWQDVIAGAELGRLDFYLAIIFPASQGDNR